MRKGAPLKDNHPLLQILKVTFSNVPHSVPTKHFISSSLKVDTRAYVRFSRACSQLRCIDRTMVTLVIATTCDPASIGPASSLLQMSPEWRPGPLLQDIPSFINGRVRLLKHDQSIVKENDLDMRWEELTGETVDEIIFLSKHTAVSNRPALTVHPIGVPHLQSYEECVAGGKPGWAGLPCPRIGAWYRLLQAVAEKQALTPEFEITLEGTHHGPVVSKPTMFVEIGSTEEYWKRQDAAHTIAMVVWQGLGLDGGSGVGNWTEAQKGKKVLVGIGGGHYVPRHMDIVRKGDVWVGHLLSGYSLPMEEPSLKKKEYDVNEIGGSWKQAIRVAVTTTQEAFPGGKILVHLDNNQVDGAWIWHKRLGHINFENLVKKNKEAMRDYIAGKRANITCKNCQMGKQTRTSFKSKELYNYKPLELVHTDLCGPTRIESLKGASKVGSGVLSHNFCHKKA